MRTPGPIVDELRAARSRIVFLEKQLQAERQRSLIERQRAEAHASATRAAYRMTMGRSRPTDDDPAA